MSELVDACQALPDFDTLQIVHYLPRPSPSCRVDVPPRGYIIPSVGQQKQESKEEVNGLKDWAMDCLRKSRTGCQEGEGRKKTMIKVIELGSYVRADDLDTSHLDVLEVEEYEV